MALIRILGALALALGAIQLALDAARSLRLERLAATSLERFWADIGGDDLFPLRVQFSRWLGAAADPLLDLPAAFVAFGLGIALLLVYDSRARDRREPPIAL